MIVVGGMQWVKRSYNRARTCKSRAGDRSAKISSAVKPISASQSGGGIGVLSDTFSLKSKLCEYLGQASTGTVGANFTFGHKSLQTWAVPAEGSVRFPSLFSYWARLPRSTLPSCPRVWEPSISVLPSVQLPWPAESGNGWGQWYSRCCWPGGSTSC